MALKSHHPNQDHRPNSRRQNHKKHNSDNKPTPQRLTTCSVFFSRPQFIYPPWASRPSLGFGHRPHGHLENVIEIAWPFQPLKVNLGTWNNWGSIAILSRDFRCLEDPRVDSWTGAASWRWVESVLEQKKCANHKALNSGRHPISSLRLTPHSGVVPRFTSHNSRILCHFRTIKYHLIGLAQGQFQVTSVTAVTSTSATGLRSIEEMSKGPSSRFTCLKQKKCSRHHEREKYKANEFGQ